MPGEFELRLNRSGSAHLDGFLNDLHLRPAAWHCVALPIRGIECLEIEVLLVQSEDGKSPRDLAIVACGDAWQPRLAGANDIRAR